jgi:phosphoglycerol transferase
MSKTVGAKTSISALTKGQLAWLAGGLLSVWLVVSAKVAGVYPTVFQDEWIYSMHSRLLPLDQTPIANYLYSWLYSGTNACGLEFYSCAKNINVLFVVAFALGLFLIARKYLGFFASLSIAVLSAVSPISTYASFFMPESMYFAFSIFAIWALLELRNRPTYWWALIAGAILGATALVKPHSLFLLPVVGVYLIFISRPEGSAWAKRLVHGASYLAGFLVFKFGFGFLVAGPSALVWFGTSYEATLNNVLNSAQALVADVPTQVLASASNLVLAAEPATAGVIELFMAQLGGHYLGLFALVGVALPSLVIQLVRRESSSLSDLTWFVSLSAVIFVPAFALFSAFAIRSGDPLQDRLVMRYYEFLVPLAIIAAVAGWKHLGEASARLRVSLVLSTALGLFLVGITGVGSYLPLIWDGAVLQGFASQRWLIGLISIASSLILLMNLGRKPVLVKILFAVLLPFSVVASSFIATDSLRANALSPVVFDIAGQYARDQLTVADQNDLVVVGQTRNELEAAKFWIDNPNVDQFVATAGSAIELASLPADTKYVITMNEVQVAGNVSIAYSGEGWNLYKVN